MEKFIKIAALLIVLTLCPISSCYVNAKIVYDDNVVEIMLNGKKIDQFNQVALPEETINRAERYLTFFGNVNTFTSAENINKAYLTGKLCNYNYKTTYDPNVKHPDFGDYIVEFYSTINDINLGIQTLFHPQCSVTSDYINTHLDEVYSYRQSPCSWYPEQECFIWGASGGYLKSNFLYVDNAYELNGDIVVIGNVFTVDYEFSGFVSDDDIAYVYCDGRKIGTYETKETYSEEAKKYIQKDSYKLDIMQIPLYQYVLEQTDKNEYGFYFKSKTAYDENNLFLDKQLELMQLLERTSYNGYPLAEYNDPINLCNGYLDILQIEATISTDVRQDGLSMDDYWISSYERCLDNLLKDDNQNAVMEMADIIGIESVLIELQENIGKIFPGSDDISGIGMAELLGLTEAGVKYSLQYYCGAEIIICKILQNTTDENLKKACQKVMYERYQYITDEIVNIIMSHAIDTVTNMLNEQELYTKVADIMIIFSENAVATVGKALHAVYLANMVLDIKDSIVTLTGMKARTENYLDCISLQTIYSAAAKGYRNSVMTLQNGKVDEQELKHVFMMFQFILDVKKLQYHCMEDMFTKKTYEKIINMDKFIQQHHQELDKITIDNYEKKVALDKLNPSVSVKKEKISLGKKTKIKVRNVAYKAKITYTSNNKKILNINKNGKIQSKKKGSAEITVVIQQYGDTIIEKRIIRVV